MNLPKSPQKMKNFRPSSLKKQSGNLLVSAVVALGIMSVVQVGVSRHTIETTRTVSGAIIGSQMTALIGVMDTYTTTYGTELKKPTPSIPGVAVPRAPTIDELQALNLTATSIPLQPYLGGSFRTSVTLVPTGCVGSACNIRHSVWLSQPLLEPESQRIDNKLLGAAVQSSKQGISYSLPNSPTVIRSSAGWSEANPDAAQRPGILAGFSGYNDSGLSVYIKRDGTQPVTADFPMTGLDGTRHSITGARNITASETITGNHLATNTVNATGTVTANHIQANSVTANATIRANDIQPVGNAAEATWCPENGRTSKMWEGTPLTCQYNVWRRAVRTTGDTMTGTLSTQAETWGMIMRNGAGQDNSSPTSAVGSAYVNDVYIRSINKWASQMGSTPTTFYEIGTANRQWAGQCIVANITTGNCSCPAGTRREMTVGFQYHLRDWDGQVQACIP